MKACIILTAKFEAKSDLLSLVETRDIINKHFYNHIQRKLPADRSKRKLLGHYIWILFCSFCKKILQTAVARESRIHWTRKRWKWCDFNTEFFPLHRLLVIHHFLAMKWIIWGRRLQGSLLVLTSVLLGTSCLKRKKRRRKRVKVKYKPSSHRGN